MQVDVSSARNSNGFHIVHMKGLRMLSILIWIGDARRHPWSLYLQWMSKNQKTVVVDSPLHVVHGTNLEYATPHHRYDVKLIIALHHIHIRRARRSATKC